MKKAFVLLVLVAAAVAAFGQAIQRNRYTTGTDNPPIIIGNAVSTNSSTGQLTISQGTSIFSPATFTTNASSAVDLRAIPFNVVPAVAQGLGPIISFNETNACCPYYGGENIYTDIGGTLYFWYPGTTAPFSIGQTITLSGVPSPLTSANGTWTILASQYYGNNPPNIGFYFAVATGISPNASGTPSGIVSYAANNGAGLTNLSVTNFGPFPTTNGTPSFQSAFNSSSVVIIPPGVYYVTNLWVTNDNVTIEGNGQVTFKQVVPGTGYCIQVGSLCTNVHMHGFTVDGQIYNLNQGSTFPVPFLAQTLIYDYTTSAGTGALPSNGRSGIKCNMMGQSTYEDLNAVGFNIAGFYLYNPNGETLWETTPTSVGTFANNQGYMSYVGIYQPNANYNDFDLHNNYLGVTGATNWSAEFINILNCRTWSNSVGVCASSGNTQICGLHSYINFCGYACEGNYNPMHGVIYSSMFEHNLNDNMHFNGAFEGELVAGCTSTASTQDLMIWDCGDLKFVGDDFQQGLKVICSNCVGTIDIGDSCHVSHYFGVTNFFLSDNTGLVTNYTESTMTNNTRLSYTGGTNSVLMLNVGYPTTTAYPGADGVLNYNNGTETGLQTVFVGGGVGWATHVTDPSAYPWWIAGDSDGDNLILTGVGYWDWENPNGVIGVHGSFIVTNSIGSVATNRYTGYTSSSTRCTNNSVTQTQVFDVTTSAATVVQFDNAHNAW